MSHTQCSVCGNKVSAEKNMITEHKDKRGKICYGSFTPVQNFDPFYVKRTVPLPGGIGGFPQGSLDVWGSEPAQEPPPQYNYEYHGGDGHDDDQFMNELRNMN